MALDDDQKSLQDKSILTSAIFGDFPLVIDNCMRNLIRDSVVNTKPTEIPAFTQA